MAKIQWKRGDTLEMTATYKRDGVAYNLDTVTIESQLRQADGTKIDDFTVVKLNQTTDPGKFTMSVVDTTAWPLVDLSFDIQYSFGGQVLSTETHTIKVVEDITR